MFLSIVVPLTALNTVEPPAMYGREAHALFLDWVQAASPALAGQLHAGDQRKPFTVSGLRREPAPRAERPMADDAVRDAGAASSKEIGRRGCVIAGQAYSLRFTSISAELSRLLLDEVLPNLPQTIRLGEAHFQTATPKREPSQHPWACQSSAEELLAKWYAESRSPGRQVSLQFASPTTIKRQGRFWVTPLPAAIFQSYLMAWNAYAGPPFEMDLLEVLERDLLITRYRLRTRAVPLYPADGRAAHQIGFVGHCAFTCFRPERALWRTLHLLADFAFFCGTGYKTTQGMGQTVRAQVWLPRPSMAESPDTITAQNSESLPGGRTEVVSG